MLLCYNAPRTGVGESSGSLSAFTSFSGNTAVVTGGASGVGKGIARSLIAQGMRVVIADIEDQPLRRTAAELGAVPVRTDVSDAASMRALARDMRARFGTVHVLCNNAGVGAMGRIADLTLEDWRWMIGVNLSGVIHGVHAFLPLLRANEDGGHIVNTASVGGLVTMPGLGAYSVAKYGVVALSEALAQELAEDGSKVGVTALCPGPTRTNIKTSTRNRPGGLRAGKLTDVDLEQTEFGARARWLAPEDVGEIVIAAMRRGDLYAFTHPEQFDAIELRFAAIRAGHAGS
jgi:NAD(P)-dependent dehydrogenase (short-subunit alcohol dehydrogenase family)